MRQPCTLPGSAASTFLLGLYLTSCRTHSIWSSSTSPKNIVTVFWYQSDWSRFHWSTPVGIIVTFVVVALLLGLIHQRVSKRVLLILGAISVLSFACVWILAFRTATYEARYALVGLLAMATLVALALQRWPTAVRWIVPVAGLVGCLIAIHHDVLGVHWT